MPPERLGLIAGGGDFPFMVARGARKAGLEVVCLALRGFADEALVQETDRFFWVGVAKVGQWIRTLKREKTCRVIVGGKVEKSDMYTPFKWLRYIPDRRTFRIWYRRSKDRRTDNLLHALADELAQEGITMENSVQYCQDHLAQAGLLGPKAPNEKQSKDIAFGWKIAKAMGNLDVGQSVCVRDLETIAVEAIEGTDQTILRAGRLCKAGGFCVVKVAKPNQDMRFDVPTIGPNTMEVMHQAGAGVLAVEAGSTVVIDPPAIQQLAGKYAIVVVGISAEKMD